MIKAFFKKISILSASLALVGSFFLAPMAIPGLVYAGSCTPGTGSAKNAVSGGVDCAGGNSNCILADGSEGTPAQCLNKTIRAVVNILSLIVGIAAVIMIIIGGFRYVTSGGDSNQVSSAKNTIIYALVGLVIVALAQVIVRFVLGRTT